LKPERWGPPLVQEKYQEDKACDKRQPYRIIIIIIGVKLDNKHWYDHVTKSVETNNEITVIILWNQQMETNRTIPNNRPDVIIRDNEKGTGLLICIKISGDIKVTKKEA
jgi:hypothetical protein